MIEWHVRQRHEMQAKLVRVQQPRTRARGQNCRCAVERELRELDRPATEQSATSVRQLARDRIDHRAQQHAVVQAGRQVDGRTAVALALHLGEAQRVRRRLERQQREALQAVSGIEAENAHRLGIADREVARMQAATRNRCNVDAENLVAHLLLGDLNQLTTNIDVEIVQLAASADTADTQKETGE